MLIKNAYFLAVFFYVYVNCFKQYKRIQTCFISLMVIVVTYQLNI